MEALFSTECVMIRSSNTLEGVWPWVVRRDVAGRSVQVAQSRDAADDLGGGGYYYECSNSVDSV